MQWSERFMSFTEVFIKNGKEIRSNTLMTEINLDNLEKGLLKISLKPYDENVTILRKHYNDKTWRVDFMHTIEEIILDCVYNDIDDSIEFNLHASFDLFIFNICALLGIGTLKINDKYVDIGKNGFAHIFQRVQVFYLTLEEFKLLNGFVGIFTFNGSSISFDGLLMRYDCIHESVSDGAAIPDFDSDCLKRGEKLFLFD